MNINLWEFFINVQGQLVLDTIRQFITMYVGSRLSKDMFDLVLKRVMKAPVSRYFDITPMSKIIGYFTGDIN